MQPKPLLMICFCCGASFLKHWRAFTNLASLPCFVSEFEEDLLPFSGVFGGTVIAQRNSEFADEGTFKPSSVNVVFRTGCEDFSDPWSLRLGCMLPLVCSRLLQSY